jgi:hypothetical protein
MSRTLRTSSAGATAGISSGSSDSRGVGAVPAPRADLVSATRARCATRLLRVETSSQRVAAAFRGCRSGRRSKPLYVGQPMAQRRTEITASADDGSGRRTSFAPRGQSTEGSAAELASSTGVLATGSHPSPTGSGGRFATTRPAAPTRQSDPRTSQVQHRPAAGSNRKAVPRWTQRHWLRRPGR